MSSTFPDPQRAEPQHAATSQPESLVRPAPALSRLARVKAAVDSVRDRLQPGNESVGAAMPAEAVAKQPLLVIALSAVGAALLAVGLLWGWQTWNARSATPVDELLPRLVAADQPGAETAATETPIPAVATTTVSALTAAPSTAVPPPSLPAAVAQTEAAEPEPPQLLVVHVAGAVRRPGVVELASGSRVFHAVDAVGGVVSDADLDRVNLAAPVVDGERLWIPLVGETSPPTIAASERPAFVTVSPSPSGSLGNQYVQEAQPIDLNLATAAALQTLPGIGPALAQAIVTTRAERGPFRSVDELVEVAGIGPATLERLRSRIIVQPPAAGG